MLKDSYQDKAQKQKRYRHIPIIMVYRALQAYDVLQSNDFSLPSSVHVSLCTFYIYTHCAHFNLTIKCQPPKQTYLK